jgi:hypothetical protein
MGRLAPYPPAGLNGCREPAPIASLLARLLLAVLPQVADSPVVMRRPLAADLRQRRGGRRKDRIAFFCFCQGPFYTFTGLFCLIPSFGGASL